MTDASGETNPALPWVDLAASQPGQAGRERAAVLYSQWREAAWWRRWRTSRSEEYETRRRAAQQVSVARQFERLGGDWRVLHGIPIGTTGERIDHLVMGPGGVFTVNSHHDAQTSMWLGGGTLMVKGERVHHLRESQADAAYASTLLSGSVGFEVPVKGLVVIVGDKRFDVRCQPEDASVRVTTPKACLRWLRQLSGEWTDYGIERIFDAARRSTTWIDEPAPASASTPKAPREVRDVPVADVTRAAS
jgi:hypothetical protein